MRKSKIRETIWQKMVSAANIELIRAVVYGVFMMLFGVAGMYAQFYDEEDMVHFYVQTDSKTSNPYVRIFNFDGQKATQIYDGARAQTIVVNNLKKNWEFHENRVFSDKQKLKYNSDKSYGSKVVYTQNHPSFYSMAPFTSVFTFSSDMSTLVYSETSNGKSWHYQEVPKEYFLDLIKEGSTTRKRDSGGSFGNAGFYSGSSIYEAPVYDNSSNGTSGNSLNDRRKDNLNRGAGESCRSCLGSGKCFACGGTKVAASMGNTYPCKTCNQTGICSVCHGTGKASWNR